jgi:hypothetical protein
MANEFFSQKQDVYIYFPGGGKKGAFRIPKIKAKPERLILKEIKNKVLSRWGVLDLLDILIEADRQVGLTRYFPSTGQRQVLSEEAKRERLVFTLFGIATNMGLKRIHTATRPSCTYDDLRYFCKRHMDQKDFHALTPLFTANINPYGRFSLDFNRPSLLEAA